MHIIPYKEPFSHSYHVLLQKIRPLLGKGSVLLYPVDTCWGLSCLMSDAEAFHKIFHIKMRAPDKAVSIAVCDMAMAHRYAHILPEVESFMKKYLPGRISLIVKARTEQFPPHILLPEGKVSLRIPTDQFTRRLVQSLGEPIITTSANMAGEKEAYTWEDIELFLSKVDPKPDVVLKRAAIAKIPPSTIIDTTVTPWKVLRQGTFVWER